MSALVWLLRVLVYLCFVGFGALFVGVLLIGVSSLVEWLTAGVQRFEVVDASCGFANFVEWLRWSDLTVAWFSSAVGFTAGGIFGAVLCLGATLSFRNQIDS